MNKTVTINLAGIIFHIDEDAYQKLSAYLISLKKSFANQEGSDEIINDIEARFAELFREKSDEVIVMDIVDEVIAIMGQPEDYMDTDYDDQENTNHKKQSEKQESSQSEIKRRIFRNPDDTMLGGVCSGIAAYFDSDPLWVRLGFVIGGFAGMGTGLFIYIILWVIIPEAKTTTEKLQMKGEPINVENISKSIQEEMEYLKKNFQGNSNFQEKAKKASKRTGNLITQIILLIGKIGIKIIAVMAILIGISFLFAILSTIFGANVFLLNFPGYINGSFDFASVHEFFNTTPLQMWLITIGFILFIGIPAIQLLLFAFKTLFKLKAQHKAVSISLVVLWLCSLGALIAAGMLTVGQFSHHSVSREVVEINNTNSDTLNLRLEKDDLYFILKDNAFGTVYDDDNNAFYSNDVELDIVKTNNPNFSLEMIKRSRGKHQSKANANARQMNYHYESSGDEIVFYDYFSCPKQQSFFVQEIDLVLHVPVGKTIILDESLRRFIYDIKNQHNMRDRNMLNHHWLMEYKGLVCVDCNTYD